MATSQTEIGLGRFPVRTPAYGELVGALVFVWGFGDAASTLLALWLTGDLGLEGNPLVRALMAHHPLLLLVLKAGVALVVGAALLSWRDVVERVPLWRAWFVSVTALGALIVVTNVYVGVVALS
ncbi:MAG: DUF5658 family protein [Haloarculaceae archaeon]